MALLFYNLGIRLYSIAVHLASPFNKKASLWVEGRKNYFANLQNKLNKKTGSIVWFHCASLGEFEQTRPLIERIKREYPVYNLLVTFYSPSGYEIRKNYEHADFVFYLPSDTAFNANKFIRVVNPKIAFFAKYEFWHYFLSELHKKKIPTISFSSIFRKDQIFFKSNGTFFQAMLENFTHLFVQNKSSKTLLNSIGITNVTVTGDTRFDRVKEICDNKKILPLVEKFKNNSKVMVAGSTWPKDMVSLFEIINDPTLKLKYIIAPHEITETHLAEIEKGTTKKCLRYSKLDACNADTVDILIIDNIGLLSSLYQYGEFAYIGGAFGKGLHNILEAATFGTPLFFGPKYQKFNEAIELVANGSAFSISNGKELSEKIHELDSNETERLRLSEKSKNYVQQHIGATQKIMNYCEKFFKQ